MRNEHVNHHGNLNLNTHLLVPFSIVIFVGLNSVTSSKNSDYTDLFITGLVVIIESSLQNKQNETSIEELGHQVIGQFNIKLTIKVTKLQHSSKELNDYLNDKVGQVENQRTQN